MAQQNEGSEKKPGVKIQDLSPKKDAKGGAARNQDSAGNLNSLRNQDSVRNQDSASQNSASQNSAGKNQN